MRIDASLAGMGAGAGNAPLEVFIAAAEPQGLESRLRPVHADGCGRRPGAPAAGPPGARGPRDPQPRLCRRLFLASCATPKRPAQDYGVDARDILVELGRRRMVGGQEDMIVDVALDILKSREVETAQ